MGSVFVVVGPVRGENLVGLAAEQQVEFLLEDVVELFAELLIEIGHHPAAELEALGRILGRPAGRLHDAIHGNHGADDNLPHGSLSLFEPRRNGPASDPHVPTLFSGLPGPARDSSWWSLWPSAREAPCSPLTGRCRRQRWWYSRAMRIGTINAICALALGRWASGHRKSQSEAAIGFVPRIATT